MTTLPPVITIDGPSASGKGTVANKLAHILGFHYLDSGKIYRALAIAAKQQHCDTHDANAMKQLAQTLSNCPETITALMKKKEMIESQTATAASNLSRHAEVRKPLVIIQRAHRQPPGLVTDGRDMGTCIFPDATLKIYLQASIDVRAQRRYHQLLENGINATIEGVHADIEKRDLQDQSRLDSPLICADDAIVIDSTHQPPSVIAHTIANLYSTRADTSRSI